jgi:hypothetical protein
MNAPALAVSNDLPRPVRNPLMPALTPEDKLPAASAAKLRRLMSERDDLFTLLRASSDVRFSLWTDRRGVAAAIARYKQTPRPISDDDPRVAGLLIRGGEIESELARVQETHEARSAAVQALGHLLDNVLLPYLDRQPAGRQLPAYQGLVPALRKGKAAAERLDEVRAEIAGIEAEAERALSAPRPSAEAKQVAAGIVARLAAEGAPDVRRLLVGGDEIAWPANLESLTSIRSMSETVSRLRMFDGLKFVAWLIPDVLIAALDREIAAKADDRNALTVQQRDAKVADLDARRLLLEREEEALIETHLPHVLRRPDASAIAVLGLADEAGDIS